MTSRTGSRDQLSWYFSASARRRTGRASRNGPRRRRARPRRCRPGRRSSARSAASLRRTKSQNCCQRPSNSVVLHEIRRRAGSPSTRRRHRADRPAGARDRPTTTDNAEAIAGVRQQAGRRGDRGENSVPRAAPCSGSRTDPPHARGGRTGRDRRTSVSTRAPRRRRYARRSARAAAGPAAPCRGISPCRGPSPRPAAIALRRSAAAAAESGAGSGSNVTREAERSASPGCVRASSIAL